MYCLPVFSIGMKYLYFLGGRLCKVELESIYVFLMVNTARDIHTVPVNDSYDFFIE
jgi:hypothetical protein